MPGAACRYNQTAPYALNTTAVVLPNGFVFLSTGGGNQYSGEWLRDAAVQLKQLVDNGLSTTSDAVAAIVEGALVQGARYLAMNGYANSFFSEAFQNSDRTMGRGGYVQTDNYELDSAAWMLWLAAEHYAASGRVAIFDELFYTVMEKFTVQVQLEQNHYWSMYRYVQSGPPPEPLPNGGKGTPVNNATGLTWSGFRPSDDACKYGYNIPQNLFAKGESQVACASRRSRLTLPTATLDGIANISTEVYNDTHLASLAANLSAVIDQGLSSTATIQDPTYGEVLAYEVDGFGAVLAMDDANLPSLLSASYYGYSGLVDTALNNSRAFVLSSKNKYYGVGQCASGEGSPHLAEGVNVWPMGMLAQGLSGTLDELVDIVITLAQTDCNTLLMHQFFEPDCPCYYTRAEFASTWRADNVLRAEN